MDNKKSSVAAALSAAASEEDKSEAKNMISPIHTSCASNRKRPFDALKDGNTAASAAQTMEAILQDMQQKMNHMQTEINTVKRNNVDIKAENTELKSKYYELENNVEDISSLKDEQNEGTYDNKERMYDMQTEIDTVRDENKDLKKKYNELEIKVKDLTLKNEYNEWSYTAENISASFWSDLGFEEYAERMVVFLGKMKEYTHQLRRGESPNDIDLEFENDNLLYDNILLPHWKELIDALVQYQKFDHREDYGIEGFVLRNIDLQQEVLDMLAPALQTLDMKKLVLGRIIGSDVLSFAEGIIKGNPHLEKIAWYNNRIESVDDMQRLCNSIKNKASTSLNAIDLDSSFDGNNSEMMQIVLDASLLLERLELSDNGIGPVGAQLIANFLASNPPLRELDIDDNDLSDNDATLFANVLQSNTNLEQLYLNGNTDITTVGRQALLDSVFNVSSLNSCVASNHKCCLYGLDPDISTINERIAPSANRSDKIFTLLSATDNGFFNMNCLGDVSYKLIPRVLNLSQEFGGRTPELSDIYFEKTGQRSADWNKLDEVTVAITSMFELLRGWAVPSLSA